MKIAIFHHQATEAGRLSVMLARLGHKPVALNSGAAVLETVLLEHFDLLIMRWDGADLCGVAVMHRLQKSADHVPPVLMLMTPDAPGGIAEAAQGWIDEPVDDAGLAAALARVIGATAGRSVHGSNDELQMVPARQQVIVRGHAVQLTAKEYALAKLLLDSVGEALSRDRIMAQIWNRADQAGSRTLDAHIAQVRKRLGLVPEHGWRLSSVYGFGYRLDRIDRIDN